jgi:hypothetical protein
MPRQAPHASTRLPSKGRPGPGSATRASRADATLPVRGTERTLRVPLAGDVSGDYVISDEREDGSLVVAPNASMAAIRRRHGLCRRRSPSSRPNMARCSLPTEKVDQASRLVLARRRRAMLPAGTRRPPARRTCAGGRMLAGYCGNSSRNSAIMRERRMERRRASASSRT